MGTGKKALNAPPISPMGLDREPSVGSGACDSKRKLESKTIQLKGISARVDRVTIEGLGRTKDDLVKRSVKDLFLAENFEEMIDKAHDVRTKLQDLGCFRNIQIHIDTSDGPGATPNGYEITYQVNELKRVSGGVTTHVSNDEGILAVNMALPNIWGRGEHLKGEYSYGSKRSRIYNLSLTKPYLWSYNNLTGTAGLFQNDFEYPMSGYKIIDRGLLLDVAFASKPKFKHNVQWEGSWRELGVGNRYASFEVRENAGNTLKSSVRHIFSYDVRDSPILPSCGSLVKLISELAGLGGNVGFLKNELQLQGNWPIYNKDFVLQLSFNTGIMNTIDENKQPFVCDNFFLGGPLSLRGFDHRGVGDQSDGNYTGAKMYWASALHIYSPLPFKPGSGGFGELFRTHVFVNAGNIGEFNFDSANSFYEEQKDSLRLAVGLGLALRLGHMARVELNYCFPILFQDSDAKINGVQFGVGVNFL